MDIISTVIDIISSLATVAAVVVALLANKKSSEQLEKALEMHEQTKNISLFEKRLSFLESMLNAESASGITFDEAELLFNEKIKNLFKNKIALIQEKNSAEFEMRDYISKLAQSGRIEADAQSIWQLFIEKELLADECEEHRAEYLRFCKEFELQIDGRVCNFSLMSGKIGELSREIRKADADISADGKKLIKQSIQAICQR